jgi:GT2 family glycosyltransferase
VSACSFPPSAITRHPVPPPAGARYAVIIPTWNNLSCLRLCVESLRRHSAQPHELVVHVSEGTDGTLDWVRAQGIAHTWSPGNAGVSLALNAAAALARADLLLYLNDDMVALPGWDARLLAAAAEMGATPCMLSATCIEPGGSAPAALAPHDFGSGPEGFREADLLAALPGLVRPDWSGASWPPMLVSRALWDRVGGFSTEFFPGHTSDQDFAMKLWRLGVRHFRGVGDSRVYHFRHRTTSRVPGSDNRRRFAVKWGLPASWFYWKALRQGQPYAGALPELPAVPGYQVARVKALLRRLLP